MDQTRDVKCRLCLGDNDLVYIFDPKKIAHPGNLQEIISLTTGVDIKQSDEITQSVCTKCCHITIRMYKFRKNALANDGELKGKHALALPSRTEKRKKSIDGKQLHDTVKQVITKNPKIVLPGSCVNINILPKVALNRSDVSDWFAARRKRKHERRRARELAEKAKIVCNKENENKTLFDPLESEAESDIPSTTHKKRKRLLSSSSESSSSKRMNQENVFMQSLDLTPNVGLNESSTEPLFLLSHVNSSFVCDICNAIRSSERELALHKKKHQKCHLCKKNFKTLEETKNHTENECEIKKIMNNLPVVPLLKIDTVSEIRTQYKSAFETQTNEQNTENVVGHTSETFGNNPPVTENTEVLYVISDDEDSPPCQEKTTTTVKAQTNVPPVAKEPVPIIEEVPSANKTAISSSVVRPNIEILGKPKTDENNIESELVVLKKLLRQKLQMYKHQNVQTDLPCNTDIKSSQTKDKLFELKDLRKQLTMYKIPVKVRYGTGYTASFEFVQHPEPKRKPKLWEGLNKVDLYRMNQSQPLILNMASKVGAQSGTPLISYQTSKPTNGPLYIVPNGTSKNVSKTNNTISSIRPSPHVAVVSQKPQQTIKILPKNGVNALTVNVPKPKIVSSAPPQGNGIMAVSSNNIFNVPHGSIFVQSKSSPANPILQQSQRPQLASSILHNSNSNPASIGSVISQPKPSIPSSVLVQSKPSSPGATSGGMFYLVDNSVSNAASTVNFSNATVTTATMTPQFPNSIDLPSTSTASNLASRFRVKDIKELQ